MAALVDELSNRILQRDEQTADCSAADIVGMVDDTAMRAAESDAEAITKDYLSSGFEQDSPTLEYRL